jgi:tetratricopeptide (TPR) repeat protein
LSHYAARHPKACGGVALNKPSVFISYSHKDEVWKDRLTPQLRALEQAGRVAVWDDRKIDGGDEWYPEIKEAMRRAAVAVCLISPDYLASPFCVKEEVPYLLARCENDGLIFLPLLVRPCVWKAHEWLKGRQMLPRDGKSVAADFKDDWDTVFAEVANYIFEIADDLGVKAFTLPAPPPPAWPPPEKVDISRLPVTGSDLFGRQKELEMLDEAWESAATNLISFVAWGGVGKSTLVNKWLERLAQDNYRGARRVYAWSFYSQGTSERATSADQFINAALLWFGDADPTAGSPWDKGERLAALVRREKTLLLLDGMEPLQSSLAYERGKIKDPALSTLITELARENPGLCVISTREAVAELDEFSDRVRQENLERLSAEAGRALLRTGGVRGTDAELEQATEDFGRHALALNLLAAYLRDIPGHHISEAAKIPDLDLTEEQGKHPRRLIAAFEHRFGEGPEVEVLRLLGLFDRPADGDSLTVLRQAPAIAGLTDHIHELLEADWLRAVQRLRSLRLIAKESHHDADELDAHPLVREHFSQQLRRHRPDAWREANNRLYEHLRRTVKELPETIEEMAPLFAAVAHGCAAGRHQETFDKVYCPRICRGKEYFSTRSLGAFGADLAALSSFFEAIWERPVATLRAETQGFVLKAAGYGLGSLVGHISEAMSLNQSALGIHIALRDWCEAAIGAGHLSSMFLSLGNLAQARSYAQQSLAFAELSEDASESAQAQGRLAVISLMAGQTDQAEAAFRKAEELQKTLAPPSPRLTSIIQFHFCDLLLERGNYQEVQRRAGRMIEQAGADQGLRGLALGQLALGCALAARARQEAAGDLGPAATYLDAAIDGIRLSGRRDELPRGLLRGAEVHRLAGDYCRAQADLVEAQRIAERGEMGLHLCDCHLEWARLHLAQGDRDKAREHWATAKAMVERMGYRRREKDVEEIARELG